MRALYEQAGISTILVAGSSGAFFYEADRVIQMDRYHVVDITDKVREICGQNEKGQSLRHSLRCRPLTERIRQPDTSGNRCTAEETAADEEDVRDLAVLRDRVL